MTNVELSLVERLRQSARETAKASQWLADQKTARQTDRDDYPEMEPRGYSGLAPEQTVQWEAAARIEALEKALRELEDANDNLCGLRTKEQYLSMVDGGQKDALSRLDDARRTARELLSTLSPARMRDNKRD